MSQPAAAPPTLETLIQRVVDSVEEDLTRFREEYSSIPPPPPSMSFTRVIKQIDAVVDALTVLEVRRILHSRNVRPDSELGMKTTLRHWVLEDLI